ncbi:MAG: phosphatase PAP2 family protein [Deltaproteobacteria bacterium]|nr:phosphatase PAP2 family protein [Deltaproteobacteria bacterium]
MPFISLRKKDSFVGVLLPELIVLFFALVALGLYHELQLPLRAPWGLYWSRIKGTAGCYAVSLVLVLLAARISHLRQGRKQKVFVPHQYTWNAFRGQFLSRREMLNDFRLLNITCIMFVVFVNLKHLIPYLNPLRFDSALYRLDQVIFHGMSGGEFLIERLGARWAPTLSSGYTLFYPYVAAVIYIFVMQRNRRLANEFLTGFFLIWFCGLLIAYAVPTTGPVFFMPDAFSHLPWTEVSDMQSKLWRHKLVLDDYPRHEAATYLISGLPSLHLAVPVFATIYLWRLQRVLALLSGLFCAMTAVTTLYFGWHWLADDIVAILLGVGIARATRRYFAPRYLYVPDAPPQPPVAR